MSDPIPQIQSLTDLQAYVYERLCEQEQLEPGAFPMSQKILARGDRPCGIYFCLHGPRAVKFTAIWEMDRNTVLFYSSTGERRHKTQLTAVPALVPVAA